MKRLLVAACVLCVCGTALGQKVQVEWKPNRYRFHCPVVPNCPPASLRRLVIRALEYGTKRLRAMGFRAPKGFGERFHAGTSKDHVRLYYRRSPGLANATAKCGARNPPFSHISIKQGIGQWQSEPHLFYYFLTHELFHIIQYSYPIFAKTKCTGLPGWIAEGTADAVALAIVRKKFSGAFPGVGPRRVKKYGGHRSYKKPLNTTFAKKSGESLQYRTSSFWRHLAEAYNNGSYDYLHRFFRVGPSDQDWLGWLGRRVLVDPSIKTALGLVYAGFLADYAGWGAKGMPGQFFGRKSWLAGGFGGCYPIQLSPKNPEATVTPALLPTSGACVSVKVSGLSAGDAVAVKVGAIIGTTSKPGDASKTDQLHLSWAASSDKQDFHCARWIRGKGKQGMSGKKALGHCVFVPNTGDLKIGGKSYPGRIWNAFRQRPGASGGFESIYILSRTAVRPSDDKPPKTQRLTATYRFLLDLGRLKVGGKKQASAKSQVIPHLNTDPAAGTVNTVPMYDRSGSPTITYTNPSSLRPTMPGMRMPSPSANVVYMLALSRMDETRSRGYLTSTRDNAYYSAMPVKRVGKKRWKSRPLRMGDTGSFRAHIMGGERQSMWISRNPGTLVVDEFSPFMLRARFSGFVCDVRRMTPKNKCPGRRRVEGTIVKAFAGLSLPSNRFTVYDTPGTAQYRATKQNFLSNFFGGGPPGSGPGPGPGPGPGSGPGGSGSGGAVKGCDCSCEALENMKKIGESMKKNKGRMPSPKAMRQIRKMARCAQSCASEFAACRREKRD